MERQPGHSSQDQHSIVKETYDEVQSDGRYEEGMARMALYHRYCQDPVIFRALGDVHGNLFGSGLWRRLLYAAIQSGMHCRSGDGHRSFTETDRARTGD